MATVIQALRELLEPRIVHKGTLELRENDSNSSCPPTKIERPGQAVALNFADWSYDPNVTIPTNRWLFPLFDVRRSKPPICRSCDYIVFYPPKPPAEQLFVFLCELKSARGQGAYPQLRNGKLLADYILSMVRLHGSVARWPSQLIFRGLILAGGAPSTKGTTRAPARATYRADEEIPELGVTIQRPGVPYPIQFFCD